METLARLIGDDTVFYWPGKSPLSGEYRGRDAVFGLFGRLAELTDGTLHLEDHDIVGNDDHTVALVPLTATRAGESLDARGVEILQWSDGQITERWAFAEDQNADDEFWA